MDEPPHQEGLCYRIMTGLLNAEEKRAKFCHSVLVMNDTETSFTPKRRAKTLLHR